MRRRRANRFKRVQRRRYRQGRRRSKIDCYTLNACYSYTQTIQPADGASVQFKPKVSDFKEFVNIYTNFEAYRFISFSVCIRPLFSVTTPEDPSPPYVIAPYKKNLQVALGFNDAQSLNQAKIYHGARTAYRNFVPAVMGAVQYYGSSGAVDPAYCKTVWSPRLESDLQSVDVPHYCCLVVWDKATLFKSNRMDTGSGVYATAAKQYEITCRAKIRLYTQKNLPVT